MKIAITGMSILAAEALTLHNNIPQGKLSERDQALISALQASNPAYEPLDATVLYALHTAREAVAQANLARFAFWHQYRIFSRGYCLV